MNAALNEFEIEIDRKKLTGYMRVQSLMVWSIAFAFLWGFLFLSFLSNALEGEFGLAEFGRLMGRTLGWFAASTLVVYTLFSHFWSKRYAESLRVRVEGPFLVIGSGKRYRTERKIHFRAISDYCSVQSPLLNFFGIEGVKFTLAGGERGKPTTICGVSNAVEVRDLLCQVDAEREGSSA